MSSSNGNNKFELSPIVVIVGFALIAAALIWRSFSETQTLPEFYSGMVSFAFNPKRIPYIVIPLAGIGILHAIAISKKKNGETGIEKGSNFNLLSWFLSISAVGGVGYLYDSNIRIFVKVLGQLLGEADFLIKNDNYDLISLLIISALLVVTSVIIISRMVVEFLPSSWLNWLNKKKESK